MLFNLSMLYIFIPYPFENTVCLNMPELKCNSVKQKRRLRPKTHVFVRPRSRKHETTPTNIFWTAGFGILANSLARTITRPPSLVIFEANLRQSFSPFAFLPARSVLEFSLLHVLKK